MAKLYLVGNAHLDPVWLWRWQEGFSEIRATFRSALDRMCDFDDFKFTSACSVYYEWIEKIDPDMFEEIKIRVKEGRWNIVGGWFLQPDCNIPDGESFARHSLIAQRYFKEKFGIVAKTGYNVDSFGHNANLPKILKLSEIDNYVFMRPMPHEKDIKESLFMWESDDESRIVTYRIPFFYNYDLSRMENFTILKEKADKENMDYMAFYGVGNHGGGPTIKLIDEINKLNIEDAVYSTPDEYFDSIDKENLKVVKDELQHHARGCYSATSFVKQYNRRCENNLIVAEKLCVMAKKLTGAKYPHKKLNKAWKNVLFNQFHDILGGCSIKKAYEDAAYLYGETLSITEQAINFAMQKICQNIDTLQGETLPSYKAPEQWKIWEHEVLGTPVVVFNPHTWKVKMPVSINQNAKKITDFNGNEIPFQLIRGDQTNSDDKYHTSFIAEVEPLGYAVYQLFAEKESKATFKSNLKITDTSLENNKIKVEFDKVTGDIAKFYDKEGKKYIIDKPCSAVLLDETDCDTWAHDKEILGDTIGTFDNPKFSIVEDGNVRITLRINTKYNNSYLERDYTLVDDSKVLTVNTKIDFHEKHRTLKFCFPCGNKIISKIAYGTIIRDENTGEECHNLWFATDNLCVATDSKYAYDTKDGFVRLTVLRSAIYADHFGKRDEFCEYAEQGIHEFSYSIFPYENNLKADKNANELSIKLLPIMDSFHTGKLPMKFTGFECDSENIMVSAIKEGEDLNDDIIRFYEINGKNDNVKIKIFGKEIETNISHNEIKTFTHTGKEINLIEW